MSKILNDDFNTCLSVRCGGRAEITIEFKHTPVLLDKTIEALDIKPDGIYVDGTLGGAGHSAQIAKHIENGKLIGIDQDDNAIDAATLALKEYGDRVSIVRDNFKNIKPVLCGLGVDWIDGALLDLGVSSHQLDEANRGFSYMSDAPLDMRMDKRNAVSAHNIINEYSQQELTKIIFEYGEERWAKRIAQFIIEQRQISSIETTAQLVKIIEAAIPKAARMEGGHPAKRTFQAIRIAVNQELSILAIAINDFVDKLKSQGRMAVITFHSLEDRIVKETFAKLANGCTCPKEFPICVCANTPKVRLVTRKPLVAEEAELAVNARSKSAKLRVIEKI